MKIRPYFMLASRKLFNTELVKLSSDEKLIWIYIFDKMEESNRKDMIDEDENLYTIMKFGELQKALNLSEQRVLECMNHMWKKGILKYNKVTKILYKIKLMDIDGVNNER